MTDAKGVVTELLRRFQAGDWEAAQQLYHPQLRVEQPPSFPHGGWHQGVEGMNRMAAEFARHWARTIDGSRLLGCGDSAVLVTTQTWTSKATGRSATVDVVELFSVIDGLISEIRVFQQDSHLLLATLEAAGHPGGG